MISTIDDGLADGGVGGGTAVPMEYSEEQLQDCISGVSSLDGATPLPPAASCWKLYRTFLQHYRPEMHEKLVLLEEAEAEKDDDTTEKNSPLPSWLEDSYNHFYETVQLIHLHNHNPGNSNKTHTLRLNQFADQPHAAHRNIILQQQQERESSLSSSSSWQEQVDRIWDEIIEQDEHNNSEYPPHVRRQHRTLETIEGEAVQVSLLDSLSSIVKFYHDTDQHELSVSHRSLKTLHYRHSANNKKKKHHHNDKKEQELHSKYSYQHASDSYRKRSTLKLDDMALRTRVYMPNSQLPPLAFSSPQVPVSIHGMEVELHKSLADSSDSGVGASGSGRPSTTNQKTKKQKQQRQNWLAGLFQGPSNKRKNEEDVSWEVPVVDWQYEETITSQEEQHHNFAKFLNWASTNNPDGVALVHSVFDQGTCGSCWAFAATGSVEASAARNAARDYFAKGLQEMVDNHTSTDNPMTALRNLMEQSQIVEAETFLKLNLSIQELLDCDTAADQGCIGGNPLLAFFYIHRYGLVPWNEYPYVGYGDHTSRAPHVAEHLRTAVSPTVEEGEREDKETGSDSFDSSLWDPFHTGEDDTTSDIPHSNTASTATCRLDKIANPIATVDSWGLLHRNHEDLIELALKYVGPVAVGMNGADPGFVNYGGGIFDSPDCDQGANHALLITGYGEENVMNEFGEEEVLRYWVARNSWGSGWGEQGFVRIKRGSGGKHIPGICGIARSPSVALGGQLRPNRYEPLMDNAFQMTAMDPTKYRGRNADYSEPSGHDYIASEYAFCDTFTPNGTKLHQGCMKVARSYDRNPAIFLATLGFFSALMAIIPLTFATIKRRRMARPFEPNSLSLNGGGSSSNGSIRRSSSGTPTETTHLLTLKEAYASIHPRDEKDKKRRGRSIVIKSNLEQDPFRMSGSLWDSRHLAASAADALARERSQDLAAAAAAALDSGDETEPLL